MDNLLPAGLRGRVILGKVKKMDLIDRQALLKQIDIDSDGEPGYYGDTWKFIDTIKNLPSATELSTNLAEVGTDCISRQSVIDMLDETKRIARQNIDGAVLMTFERVLDSLVNITNALSTIQPDIVRCKDCEHGVLDDSFPHQYFCVFKGDEWNNADYFCGHAKRRGVTRVTT